VFPGRLLSLPRKTLKNDDNYAICESDLLPYFAIDKKNIENPLLLMRYFSGEYYLCIYLLEGIIDIG
jgi:hypothetical protein